MFVSQASKYFLLIYDNNYEDDDNVDDEQDNFFSRLRCELSMNHEEDKIPHHTSKRCIYQAQFENKVYVCKVNFFVQKYVSGKSNHSATSIFYHYFLNLFMS